MFILMLIKTFSSNYSKNKLWYSKDMKLKLTYSIHINFSFISLLCNCLICFYFHFSQLCYEDLILFRNELKF